MSASLENARESIGSTGGGGDMRRFFSVASLGNVRSHLLAADSSSDWGTRLGLFRAAAAVTGIAQLMITQNEAEFVDGSARPSRR